VLRLASLLWRLRRATTMETGQFEIQADHLAGLNQPRQVPPGPREVVYALFGRAESGSFDTYPTSHGSAYETGDVPGSIPTIEFARCFCDSPICPTARSTASADMKQPFGAKPGRSFLLLMSWLAASHGIEGAVSLSAADKNCHMSPRNLNFRAH
jgi:hypothetical protein